MAQELINVPNIGDSRDVDVVEVLVKVGARLEREQTMIVLESEKASMDVPAPRAGTVREVKVRVGDKVSEGSAILLLDIEDGAAAGANGNSGQPQPTASGEGVGFMIDGTSTTACRGRGVDTSSAQPACPGDPGKEQVRSWHLAY